MHTQQDEKAQGPPRNSKPKEQKHSKNASYCSSAPDRKAKQQQAETTKTKCWQPPTEGTTTMQQEFYRKQQLNFKFPQNTIAEKTQQHPKQLVRPKQQPQRKRTATQLSYQTLPRTPTPLVKHTSRVIKSTQHPPPRQHLNLLHHLIPPSKLIIENNTVSSLPNYPNRHLPNQPQSLPNFLI